MKTLIKTFLLFFVVLTLPVAAFADWKVFVLETMHVPVVEEHSQLIQEYLQETADKEGRKIQIKAYNADGKLLPARKALLEALEDFRPDLVISVATLATQVAAKTLKGSDIPHLFCVVADPVGGGIIPASGPDEEHRISGLVYGVDRKNVVETATHIIRSKPLEGRIHIGVIFSSYPSAISDYKAFKEEWEQIPDITLVPFQVPYIAEEEGMKTMLARAEEAMKNLEAQVDYWWQLRGPLAEDQRFYHLFHKSAKPVLFGNNIDSVRHGAVLTMAQQTTATSREMTDMSIAVLKGHPVNDYPIGYAKAVYSAVNMLSAEKHGLSIPESLIESSGENVFRTIK